MPDLFGDEEENKKSKAKLFFHLNTIIQLVSLSIETKWVQWYISHGSWWVMYLLQPSSSQHIVL